MKRLLLAVVFGIVSCSQTKFESSQSAQAVPPDEEDASAEGLDLSVNGSPESISIAFEDDILIQWKTVGYESCIVSVGEKTVSAENAGEHTEKYVDEDVVVHLTCDGASKDIKVSIDKADPKTLGQGTPQLTIQPFKTIKDDTEELDNATLYFLIDVTFSMDKVLEVILAQISDFASEMRAANVEIHLGAIFFRDEIEDNLFFGADVDKFKEVLSTYSAEKGDDYPEGSLKALQDAAVALMENENRRDALRSMILVTDTWGHDQSPGYSCEIDKTVEAIQSVFAQDASKWALFYSAKSFSQLGTSSMDPEDLRREMTEGLSGEALAEAEREYEAKIEEFEANNLKISDRGASLVRCRDNWKSPAVQYDTLFQKLHPEDSKGSHRLPWPFEKEAMLTQLTERITRAVDGNTQSCLATDLELRRPGQDAQKWSVDAKDAWESRSQPFQIASTDNLDPATTEVYVRYCCLPTSAAEAGQFGECKVQGDFEKVDVEFIQ